MLDLDLKLRTPGTLMLMRRPEAHALVERALEMRPIGRPGLLDRALGLFGRKPRGEEHGASPVLAAPRLAWAADVEPGEGYCIVDGVAVLDICGLLTPDGYCDWWTEEYVPGYAQIGAAIETARGDGRVTSILLRINSPGGFTDGCFELADAIRLGNASNGGKPIWAHARQACSAAYALAAGCDRILADEQAEVGSIGVYMLHVDESGWLAEHGIKVEAIQAGARKTDGAFWKPLDDQARVHLQGVVDQVARRFVGVVADGRGLSAEAISGLEGQWFLAEHDDPAQSGQALGLVDGIATERTAFAEFTRSLTVSTGAGAPDGSGSNAAQDAARATSATENDMSLKEQIDALRAKAAKGDKSALEELKALGVPLKAAANEGEPDDEEEKPDDTETAAAEGDDAENDDEKPDEEGDEPPEPNATGSKAGFALLDAPEAKGRDALARKLARKVGARKLTYSEAVEMLAAAPRGSRLSEAMAGRDRNPGRDGGSPAKATGLAAAVDRQVERIKARR